MRLAIIIGVLLAAVAANAEPLGPNAKQPPQPSQPPFEIVRDHYEFDVNADASYTEKHEAVMRILTQQGLQMLRQANMAYSEGAQDGQLVEAYTLKANGTRIDVPHEKYLLNSSSTALPGLGAIKMQSAVFQNVEIGDEVGWTTTLKQIVPWFPGRFSTSMNFPPIVAAHDVTLTLTAPQSGLDLHFDVSGFKGGTPETVTERTGWLSPTQQKLRWTWTFTNDAPITAEYGAVDDSYTVPHFIVSSFPDYASIAKAYEARARDKAEPTDDIRALADQLTAGVTDRKEQAHRLYDWVSANIKYISIVFGVDGIVPHPAGDVLHNRFGDCKDHVTLLQALLSAKGIASTTALIFAGNAYRLSDVASPGQFNHVITYVPEFDLYLDSTARYAPFGILPFEDSDKPVVQTATGTIAHTPVAPAASTSVLSVSTVKLKSDGTGEGDTQVTAMGALGIGMRGLMASVPSGSETDFVRASVEGNAISGTLTKTDPALLTDPYTLTMHYDLANVATFPGPGAVSMWLGYHPYSFGGSLSTWLPERTLDYSCPSMTAENDSTIELPANTAILAMPKAGLITVSGVTLSTTYETLGPETVKQIVKLKIDHPHSVCSADYYNKTHSDLEKALSLLNTQLIYK
jgi:transglutaminase-like putative cysteine protease